MAAFANDPNDLGFWPPSQIPGVWTFATLPIIANLRRGVLGFTTDQQLCYWNGTTWNPLTVTGTGLNFSNSISVMLATNQNNYTPTGYVQGTTNRVLMGAASGGSMITGFVAANDGVTELWMNTSTTDMITFPHQSTSSVLANRFTCPGAVSVGLGPLSSTLVTYVGNTWVFV